MGVYDVDFSKSEIIVDGHICVETEYDGIYEVKDEFKVTMDWWSRNSLNHNLSAMYLYNDNFDEEQKVLYICRYDNNALDKFITENEKIGRNLSVMSCLSCDGMITMGGSITW